MSDGLLKLDDQFCFTAYAVARAVSQAYEPLLAKLELTYPQYLVMLVLWERDQINLKRLGQALRLDSGTLTPIIKRLAAKGYLTKQRRDDDERELLIALTPAGRRLKTQAAAVPHGLLCRLNVPLAEVVLLRDSLKRLLVAMDTQAHAQANAQPGTRSATNTSPPRRNASKPQKKVRKTR